MKIFHELKRTVELLNDYTGKWALCGGVAASIYRKSPRFTNDIDFAFIDGEKFSAKEMALSVIERLGYQAQIGFFEESPLTNKLANGLICARLNDNNDRFIGIDFLLPIQSWIEPAVNLAQKNQINFGFAFLPTITPECLILAKMYALSSNPERIQDLDDIKNIMNDVTINYEFLKREINRLGLVIKNEILSVVFEDFSL